MCPCHARGFIAHTLNTYLEHSSFLLIPKFIFRIFKIREKEREENPDLAVAQPRPLNTGIQAEVAALLGCIRFPFQHIQLQGGTEQAVVGSPFPILFAHAHNPTSAASSCASPPVPATEGQKHLSERSQRSTLRTLSSYSQLLLAAKPSPADAVAPEATQRLPQDCLRTTPHQAHGHSNEPALAVEITGKDQVRCIQWHNCEWLSLKYRCNCNK